MDTTNTIITIGTTIATTLAAKGIESPGKSLGNLWDIAIGNRIAAAYEKSKFKHNLNVEDFKNKLINNVSAIKKENLQEPKISIVGPALEASKYYFEEEEIRELFANLIASSMDSTYNGIVQHSFVEIIKQLSPHDAKLFKELSNNEAIVSLVDVNSQEYTTIIINKLYISSTFRNYELNEISIDNLIRLGLVSIIEDSFLTENSLYEKYSKLGKITTPFELEKNSRMCLKKHMSVTSLGRTFRKICIKDSL